MLSGGEWTHVEELDGVITIGADSEGRTCYWVDYRDGSHALSYTATGWRETGGRVEPVEPGDR